MLKSSIRLNDFTTYKISKVKYLIYNFILYENIYPQYVSFLTYISKEQVPNDYLEAIKKIQIVQCNAWRIKYFRKNKTWVIKQLPKGKKLIRCKWVYKIKYNSNDTIEIYKVRLVAKGFTQIYDIDY
jgi:Reverse transcriptase (RNA-dependent DNA polymerase)